MDLLEGIGLVSVTSVKMDYSTDRRPYRQYKPPREPGTVPAVENHLFKPEMIARGGFLLDLIRMVKSTGEATLKQKRARSKSARRKNACS